MNANEVLVARIMELLKQNNMTRYRLAMNSGVPHATLKNIMNGAVSDTMFSTVVQIANGFDMTVSEFLDDPIFIKFADSI